MINIPEWITAGTAMTAVVGGLFGVYATTQSRLDVTQEKLERTFSIVQHIAKTQEGFGDRILRNELEGKYLKELQVAIGENVVEVKGDVKQANEMLLKLYIQQEGK